MTEALAPSTVPVSPIPAIQHPTSSTSRKRAYPLEVWWRIIDELPLKSMLQLAHTCKGFKEQVYRQIPYNIRTRYRAYITDVDSLEQVMEATGAVAFGSFVASFVSGAPHWEPQNLDFIICGGDWALDTFASLLYRNNYVEAGPPHNPQVFRADPRWNGYDRRRIFHRHADNAQITLLNCVRGSTAHTLLNSYATLSFQFLTPKYFCCAYPFLTLFDNVLINPLTHHMRMTYLLWERYDKRGYDHWTYGTDARRYAKGVNKKFLCPHRMRFIGDSGCLVIPLTRTDTWTPKHEFLNKHGSLALNGLCWMVGGDECPIQCGSRDDLDVKEFFGRISPELTIVPF